MPECSKGLSTGLVRPRSRIARRALANSSATPRSSKQGSWRLAKMYVAKSLDGRLQTLTNTQSCCTDGMGLQDASSSKPVEAERVSALHRTLPSEQPGTLQRVTRAKRSETRATSHLCRRTARLWRAGSGQSLTTSVQARVSKSSENCLAHGLDLSYSS